jgi:hypothetical protein
MRKLNLICNQIARTKLNYLAFASIFFSSILAQATLSQTFSLDGKLTLIDGTTIIEDSDVKIRVQILNPIQECVLYDETQTVSTATTKGLFNIQVGSATTSLKRSAYGSLDSGLTMSQVYNNKSVITGKNLTTGMACTYNPKNGDNRYLRITITASNDGVPHTLYPNMALNSVPSALVAENAETLQGATPEDFVNIGNESLTQENVESIFTDANFSKLTSILSVPATNYVQIATNGTLPIKTFSGNPQSIAEGQMWYDSTAHMFKFRDNTGTQSIGSSAPSLTSIVAGTGLTGGTVNTSGQTIAVDVGTAASKILQLDTDAKIPAVDGSLLTSVNAAKISGTELNIAALADGNIIKYNGTKWVNLPDNDTLGGLSCVNGNIAFYTAGSWACKEASSTVSNSSFVIRDSNGGIAASSVNTPAVKIADGSPGNTGGVITFSAPIGFTSYNLQFPGDAGASNQFLKSNGSGVLSWATPLSSITAGTGLTGGTITATGTIAVDVGTSANQIVQLDSSSKIPAVDGSLLTAVSAAKLLNASLNMTLLTPGQFLKYNGTNWVNSPDTLGGLSCSNGNVASYNGSSWICRDLDNFAGNGALTFTAGGTNSSITLSPTGTGSVVISSPTLTISGNSGTIESGSTICATVGAVTRDTNGDLYVCN